MNEDTRTRFESLLIKTGTASAELLEQVKEEPGRSLAAALVEEHGCNRDAVLDVLAEVFRMPAVIPTEEVTESEAMNDLTPELCLRCMAVPLRIEDGHLVVAFADPEDLAAVDEIQAAVGKTVRERVALASDIRRFFLEAGSIASVGELVNDILNSTEVEEAPPIRLSTESEAQKPAVRLLDGIIEEAIQKKALHLYLIPFDDEEVRVRLCLERSILETRRYPLRLHANIVNRLRLLCDLVGKDKRVPQKGAFRTVINDVTHRLDAMIVPSASGDAVTLFLDQEEALAEMDTDAKTVCKKCDKPVLPKWVYCPMCGCSQKD